MKEAFIDKFIFVPYQSIGNLKFKESEDEIKLKLGNIEEEYDNYGGGKTIVFSDLESAQIYLDKDNKFFGIHFFESIKFILNEKVYDINFEKFEIKDLKTISDDFCVTSNEEGVDYTSRKLGIDFYFNTDNCLEAVLFMSKDYYNNQIA